LLVDRGVFIAVTVALGVLLALVPLGVGAEPVAVRFHEGAAHGFVVLRGERGEALAHGEMVQTKQAEGMQSRLIFRFADGSLYDEIVTFSQTRVFRLLSYKLIQKGSSFAEASEVSFDRSGRYRVLIGNDEPVEGSLEVPDDVHNGMTGMLLRNLASGASAKGHIVAFTPKPRLLSSTMRPEDEDRYFVGDGYPLPRDDGGRRADRPRRIRPGQGPSRLTLLDFHRAGAGVPEVPGRDIHEGPDVADRAVGPALGQRTLSGPAPRARCSISISTSRL
jgi:hypothetical protein